MMATRSQMIEMMKMMSLMEMLTMMIRNEGFNGVFCWMDVTMEILLCDCPGLERSGPIYIYRKVGS